jgi:L-lactate dehydrogenase complex protein LldG
MTPPARERILLAVREGLKRAVLPDAGESGARRPAQPSAIPPAGGEFDRFCQVLESLTGRVHHATDAADVPEIIAGIAAGYGASTFISWNERDIGVDGLFAALASCGLSRVEYDVPSAPDERLAEATALAGIGLGITGADAAVADAGAIVLAHGPGRGRLASLLTPVHVAVLRRDAVWASLPALLAARPDLLARGSNLAVIAGPSRTADIEMTLMHGVHGPKHVHVVVVA